MKFGIFYELQLPRPWEPHSEFRLYQNALDQVELADKLGYDFAWEVEHHFLEEYSHSPAPEVFLAAASQRTKQIRLAHGIMQLTTVHPARVAERLSGRIAGECAVPARLTCSVGTVASRTVPRLSIVSRVGTTFTCGRVQSSCRQRWTLQLGPSIPFKTSLGRHSSRYS